MKLTLSSGAFIIYGHHTLIAGNRKASIDGVIITIIVTMSSSARKSCPVQFFGPKKIRLRPRPVQTFSKTNKTGPAPKKTETAVFFSLWTSLGLNRVLAGSDRFFDCVNNKF